MRMFANLVALLAAVVPSLAHVNLRYPQVGILNDFLDNVRTTDLCGVAPNRGGEAAAWQISEFNQSVVTTAEASSSFDVSWDLHYAHQGGFRIELYSADLTLLHTWNDSAYWGCSLDTTVQNVTIDLPSEPCSGCLLRFERQAIEWGDGYLFRSCALLDIVTPGTGGPEAPCNGCSGRGTCGDDGECICESSEASGFFYGAHCEFENECEEDVHCGSNGRCIDVGDVSGPANQCFCEMGFFGDVVRMASGLERRVCDRESLLQLDPATIAWETFRDGYNRTLDSPADTFGVGFNPGSDSIEFAMQARSTSWISMGLRSSAGAGTIADDSADDGASATRRLRSNLPEASAPLVDKEGAGRWSRRSLLRSLADATATATDAATDGDDAPAAEGDPDGAGCTEADIDLPNLFVPGDLGAGTRVAASTGRRLHGMPGIEPEGPSKPREVTVHRTMLNVVGEGVAAPTDDAIAIDSYSTGPIEVADPVGLGAVAGGVCGGYPSTPLSAHKMVNMDVTFAQAREVDGTQYFRIVDMFTPSRAKPQPDFKFCDGTVCGTDDILDAIGAEVNGETFIKFTRATKTGDIFSDACYSEEQEYTGVFAFGQLTSQRTHVPFSSLEILPSSVLSNRDFYQPDELKFHGGGAGSGFQGRGTLGGADFNLFREPEAPSSDCKASSLAPEFDCEVEHFGGQVTVHFTMPDATATGVSFAVESPVGGWVALGLPNQVGGSAIMQGSAAVIATSDARNGNIGVFHMEAYNVAGVQEPEEASADFTISDESIERTATGVTARFTRAFDDVFTAATPFTALVAYHDDSQALAVHTQRSPFGLALSGGDAPTIPTDSTPRNRRIHAILMIISWGFMLPMGVAMANTLRTFGPVWFQIHRATQTIGLILATIGVAIAVTQFEALERTHRHRTLGIAVMVLGWLQPLNALIRPHAPKEGSSEPKTTLRTSWEFAHKGIGYLTLALAVAVIFFGLEVAETFEPFARAHSSWMNAYVAILVAVVLAWWGLLTLHFWRQRRIQRSGKAQHVPSAPPSVAGDDDHVHAARFSGHFHDPTP